MLTLLHFRKNAGLFDLLLETAQRDIEIVILVTEKNSWQRDHPLVSKSGNPPVERRKRRRTDTV